MKYSKIRWMLGLFAILSILIATIGIAVDDASSGSVDSNDDNLDDSIDTNLDDNADDNTSEQANDTDDSEDNIAPEENDIEEPEDNVDDEAKQGIVEDPEENDGSDEETNVEDDNSGEEQEPGTDEKKEEKVEEPKEDNPDPKPKEEPASTKPKPVPEQTTKKEIQVQDPYVDLDISKISPEDRKYILLNQFDGSLFSIDTDKSEYAVGEDVLATINAPPGSDVELYYSFNGIDQFAKIPGKFIYPFDYFLPLPRNLQKGSYSVKAAIYYSGMLLKTEANFNVVENIPLAKATGTGTSSADEKEHYNMEDIVVEAEPDDLIVVGNEAENNIEKENVAAADVTIFIPVDLVEKVRNTFNEYSLWDISKNVEYGKDGIRFKISKDVLVELQDVFSEYGLSEASEQFIEDTDYIELSDIEGSNKDSMSTLETSSDGNVKRIDTEAPKIIEAEVGKPVRWEKKIKAEELDNLGLVENAKNVKLKKMIDGDSYELDDSKYAYVSGNLEVKEAFMSDDYIVEFETDAPVKIEADPIVAGDEWSKAVTIASSPEYEGEYEYKDVKAYADIDESYNGDIKLYWYVDGNKRDVTNDPEIDVEYVDTDDNGIVDRIEWVVPHLSTQNFEIVIYLKSNLLSIPGIELQLNSPADFDYLALDSNILFDFDVMYNYSFRHVRCNVTLDNEIIRQDMDATSNVQVIFDKTLEEGLHSWNVNCINNDTSAISQTEHFIIDMDNPTIDVITANNTNIYTNDSLDLEFITTDNFDKSLECNLTINNNLVSSSIVNNGTISKFRVVKPSSGLYDYYITCKDSNNNFVQSKTYRFVSLDQGTSLQYSIEPNKQSYHLNENGYMIIKAPQGTNITLFVVKANLESFTKQLTGVDFPYVEIIDYNQNSGQYYIDGLFRNGESIHLVKTNYSVYNDFSVTIDTNISKVALGEAVYMSSTVNGGIGPITYTWDFGDATFGSEPAVSHSFGNSGEYTVKLTVTDSKGNKAETSHQVDVRAKKSVTISVKDFHNGTVLQGADVYFGDSNKSTDSNGQVSFTVFEGPHSLLVKYPGYVNYDNTVTVDTSSGEFLVKLRAISSLFIDSSGKDEEANFVQQPEEQDKSTGSDNVVSTESSEGEVLAGEIEEKINDLQELYDSLGKEEQEVIEVLGLRSIIEEANKNAARAKRDLFSIDDREDLSEEDRDKTKNEILDSLVKLKESIVVNLNVMDSLNYVEYPAREDVENSIGDYLKYKNLDEKAATKDYLEDMISLQSLVTISTKAKTVHLEYMNGNTKEITLITKDVDTHSSTQNVSLLEVIPKVFAKDIEDVDFTVYYETVNKDPIAELDINKFKSYSYYFENIFELDDTKNIKSIVVFEPSSKKNSTSGITGFAIFSQIKDIPNKKLWIEIIIILILAGVYVAYQFELVSKVKDSHLMDMVNFLEGNDIKEIKKMIKRMNQDIDNEFYDKATAMYNQIQAKYISLDKKHKAKIHKMVSELYNDVLFAKISEILTELMASIELGNLGEAKQKYLVVQDIYKQLPEWYKKRVGRRCKIVYNKLVEAYQGGNDENNKEN